MDIDKVLHPVTASKLQELNLTSGKICSVNNAINTLLNSIDTGSDDCFFWFDRNYSMFIEAESIAFVLCNTLKKCANTCAEIGEELRYSDYKEKQKREKEEKKENE